MKLDVLLATEGDLPTILAHHRSGFRQLVPEEAGALERRVSALGERTCGCVPPKAFPHLAGWSDFDRDAIAEDPEPRERGCKAVRKWLFRCGVPFSRTVFVGNYTEVVVATTWKLFIRYWQRFVYYEGLNDFYVTDKSSSFLLGHCHHGHLSFGSYRDPAARPSA